MSRGLSSRNVALCDQILAVLTDAWPLPVPTGQVWRKISPYRPRPGRLAALARGEYVPPQVPYSCVLNMLNWLARLHAVVRSRRAGTSAAGSAARFGWPSHDRLNAARTLSVRVPAWIRTSASPRSLAPSSSWLASRSISR